MTDCKTNRSLGRYVRMNRKADQAYDRDCDLVLTSKRCKNSWDPECWVKNIDVHMDRLRGWDFNDCYHLVLTVERSQFRDGFEAYQKMQRRRCLSRLFRDLRRTNGYDVCEYQWFLEFHGDGFPHWHVLFKSNRMIRVDEFRHHWFRFQGQDIFSYIHVEKIRNQSHWDGLTGYLSKHGYFNPADHPDGKARKADQGKLPEWGRNYKGQIRRTGRNQREIEESADKEIKRKKITKMKPREKREKTCIGERLEKCGKQTVVRMYYRTVDLKKRIIDSWIINSPISEIRQFLDMIGIRGYWDQVRGGLVVPYLSELVVN